MGRPNSRIAPVRVSGPLAVYAEGFHAVLADLGYTPLSAVTQMRLMGYLSRQLAAEGLTAVDLDSRRIDQFLATRRPPPEPRRSWRRSSATCSASAA